MAAASRVVMPVELLPCHKVGVGRTRVIDQVGIVARTGVSVAEQHRQRRACGVSLENSGNYLGNVRLFARGSPHAAATPSSRQITLEVGCRQGNSRRHPVHHDPQRLAMRFAEDRYSEIISEAVHNRSKIRRKISRRIRRRGWSRERRRSRPRPQATSPCGGRGNSPRPHLL